MKYLLLLVISMCLFACSQSPQVDTSNMADNPGGMAKVKRSGFDKAFVDSESGFESYTAFMFAPLDTTAVEVESPEIQRSRESMWEFTDKDASQMSEAYKKAVTQAFKKEKGMKLVEKAGPGVILVKSKLTRFAPTTPKFDSIDRTPRSRFYARSSANFTMETELFDSQSNKPLATIIENREMGDNLTMEEITTARYALDMRMGFDRWARNFRTSIDKMKEN
ncbi:hypothetical protein TDB9533_02802 [Thalassocella blandensis]|nr:hypothetical protein TDB9533_02802 [Thalassocella blandensis]